MLPTAVHPTNAASTALLTTISVICMLFLIDAESAKAKLIIIDAFVTRISHGDPAKDESARQTADEHTQKRPTLIQLHSM